MKFEIRTENNIPGESEKAETEDTVSQLITSGGCNDSRVTQDLDALLRDYPKLLVSAKIERAVGLRLQDLVVHAKAKDHHDEIIFLDKLFSRIQDARRENHI